MVRDCVICCGESLKSLLFIPFGSTVLCLSLPCFRLCSSVSLRYVTVMLLIFQINMYLHFKVQKQIAPTLREFGL